MIAVHDSVSPVDVVLKLLSCEEDREELLLDLRIPRFSISHCTRDVGDRLIVLEQGSAETG